MKKAHSHLFTTLIFLLLLISGIPGFAATKTLPASSSATLVYQISVTREIGPTLWRQVKQGFENARARKAGLILLHMNTYGGRVIEADSIRSRILNSSIPVYVYIDNNAASAGALIALACDRIYMRSGSSIGAATVVNQTGEKMPDKYQSYMRSIMRATAEAQGKDTLINNQDTTIRWHRNPKIAEAMVDERIVIPQLTDSGKVITFTPQEAIQYGFCEGMATSVTDLLHKAGIMHYTLEKYHASFIEQIIGFLVNPIVSGLLIMAILGGIYFELQSPGIGFPLILAICAAAAYFAPLYLEGLAANWEIILFIAGLILIALELFVIPGFGISGILGILFTFSGLVLSLLGNDGFNFGQVRPDRILRALATVITGLFTGFLLSLYLSQKVFTAKRGFFKDFSLQSIQNPAEGYLATENHNELIGKCGTALTVLRPSGKVRIDGKIYDAVAQSGMIEQDQPIHVLKSVAAQLLVDLADEK